MSRIRQASYGRLAVAALCLPVPAVSSGLMNSGALEHVPKTLGFELADDFLNHSEHVRQGFDAKGYHLPEFAPVAKVGESAKIPYVSNLSDSVLSAPGVDADSPDRQDVIGGIRHANGLKNGGRYSRTLDARTCEDIPIRVSSKAKVKAVTADTSSRDALLIGLDRSKLRICNNTDLGIHESALESVYIEVTDPR